MSYTRVPPGPIPRACTQCGALMRQRVAVMLPLDPQTGKGATWLVTECPHHYSTGRGNWGTKHHYHRWKAWYHDAFMIKPVPEDYVILKEPEVKEPMPTWHKWAIAVIAAVLALSGIVQCVKDLPT